LAEDEVGERGERDERGVSVEELGEERFDAVEVDGSLWVEEFEVNI
jgi:hypothetical protein